jgi:hypothetical protein
MDMRNPNKMIINDNVDLNPKAYSILPLQTIIYNLLYCYCLKIIYHEILIHVSSQYSILYRQTL